MIGVGLDFVAIISVYVITGVVAGVDSYSLIVGVSSLGSLSSSGGT